MSLGAKAAAALTGENDNRWQGDMLYRGRQMHLAHPHQDCTMTNFKANVKQRSMYEDTPSSKHVAMQWTWRF